MLLLGILCVNFGWIALLWGPLGFIFGIYSTSNIVLPILMGAPLATSLILKKQMRPTVYFALLRAPLILFIILFLIGWLFPTAAEWIWNNQPFNIAGNFGFLLILLSPISKIVRTDFRVNFDNAWGKYYIDQENFNFLHTDLSDKNQLKQIESIIRISSNLYLQDIKDSLHELNLEFSDSRFRLMIFSLSAAIKSCEDLLISPDSLQKECLHFISTFATSRDSIKDYFNEPIKSEQAESNGASYLKEFNDGWNAYYAAKKNDGKNALEILCKMLYSSGTNKSLSESDKQRLQPLCFSIGFFIDDSMRHAFIELNNK